MTANKDVRYLMLIDKYRKVYLHTDSKQKDKVFER